MVENSNLATLPELADEAIQTAYRLYLFRSRHTTGKHLPDTDWELPAAIVEAYPAPKHFTKHTQQDQSSRIEYVTPPRTKRLSKLRPTETVIPANPDIIGYPLIWESEFNPSARDAICEAYRQLVHRTGEFQNYLIERERSRTQEQLLTAGLIGPSNPNQQPISNQDSLTDLQSGLPVPPNSNQQPISDTDQPRDPPPVQRTRSASGSWRPPGPLDYRTHRSPTLSSTPSPALRIHQPTPILEERAPAPDPPLHQHHQLRMATQIQPSDPRHQSYDPTSGRNPNAGPAGAKSDNDGAPAATNGGTRDEGSTSGNRTARNRRQRFPTENTEEPSRGSNDWETPIEEGMAGEIAGNPRMAAWLQEILAIANERGRRQAREELQEDIDHRMAKWQMEYDRRQREARAFEGGDRRNRANENPQRQQDRNQYQPRTRPRGRTQTQTRSQSAGTPPEDLNQSPAREKGKDKTQSHRRYDSMDDPSSSSSESSRSPSQSRRPSRYQRQRSPEGRLHHREDGESRSPDGRSYQIQWRPDCLGFFDPFLDTKEFPSGPVIDKGGKVYYRSVNAFIDAAECSGSAYGYRTVRENLDKCLRGTAHRWFISQLTSRERARLRGGYKLKRWAKALKRKWTPSTRDAWDRIERSSYGPQDAIRDRPPAEYVLELLADAEDAGIAETKQRLKLAWQRLHPDYQDIIPEPNSRTSIESFIRSIEEKKYSTQKRHRESKYTSYRSGTSSTAYGYQSRNRNTAGPPQRPMPYRGQDRFQPLRGGGGMEAPPR